MSELTSVVAVLERIERLLEEWKNEPAWFDKPLSEPSFVAEVGHDREDASEVWRLMRLGSERLVATKGSDSRQNPATILTAVESASLFQACERIAFGREPEVTAVTRADSTAEVKRLRQQLASVEETAYEVFADSLAPPALSREEWEEQAEKFRTALALAGVPLRAEPVPAEQPSVDGKASTVVSPNHDLMEELKAKARAQVACLGVIDDPVVENGSSYNVVVMPTKSDGKTETTNIFRNRRKCVVTSEVDDRPEPETEIAAKVEGADPQSVDYSPEVRWFEALLTSTDKEDLGGQQEALRQLRNLGVVVEFEDGGVSRVHRYAAAVPDQTPEEPDQADNSAEPGVSARNERLSELGGEAEANVRGIDS